MATSQEMKDLTQAIISSVEDYSDSNNEESADDLIPYLEKITDINENLLQKRDDSIAIDGGKLIITATSHSPQFSILHLQVLLWVLSGPHFQKNRKNRVILLVQNGANIDKIITGVKTFFSLSGPNNEHIFQTTEATPKEYLSSMILSLLEDSSAADFSNADVKDINETIAFLDDVKGRDNQFPRFAFPQSVASVWSSMLFSPRFSDITFVCEDGTMYPAHQVILAGASPYFQTYFNGLWAEQHSQNDGQWKTKVPSNILKHVLTFIYTGKFDAAVENDIDTIVGIFEVAHEYLLSELVSVCYKIAKSNLSTDNITKWLCLSHSLNSNRLWDDCIQFVIDNVMDLFLDTTFAALSVDNPGLWTDLQKEISLSRKRKETSEGEELSEND